MTLPPLPEPDTHCWDDDTGRDVWSHSTAQLIAYAEQAVAAQVDRLREDNERLLLALREIADDYADRFDMDSPSTNPGIKYVVQQARAALKEKK